MNRPAFSLYDASAGSGKTYALVREYLKIILTATSDDAYRNILAITFTNKAVHEMKSRIVSSLSEFAKDHPSEKAQSLLADISCEVNISETALKEKAKQIIRHIIHNYAAFDISTIDKFTHRVIRAFAHDLNLPVTFEVSLDTENLLTEAVDALIARAGDDQTLTDLLVDFTMEKTDDDKSWDISREIIETGKLILNENHRHEIAHLKGKSIPEFRQAKTHLQQQVKAIDEENKSVAKMLLQTLDERGIDPASFSYGTFPKHLREIAATGCAEKRYASPEEVAVKQTAHDGDIIRGLLPDMVSALSKVYENLQRRGFYSAFLKNITPLSLLNTVDDQLAQIQQEQHILSISEFNKLVHEQIQGQPAPFIYERLGERYRHFFIDEFQDTSEMQWENLIPLIDNATQNSPFTAGAAARQNSSSRFLKDIIRSTTKRNAMSLLIRTIAAILRSSTSTMLFSGFCHGVSTIWITAIFTKTGRRRNATPKRAAMWKFHLPTPGLKTMTKASFFPARRLMRLAARSTKASSTTTLRC
jgi:ATP-dependent exoDNAse (exonuclease V) beta subunit